MKKIYQHPQTLVVIIATSSPLQASKLPAWIQDPTISNNNSGSRAAESFWDDDEANTRKTRFDDVEEDYE